jgi:hypothetical protein
VALGPAKSRETAPRLANSSMLAMTALVPPGTVNRAQMACSRSGLIQPNFSSASSSKYTNASSVIPPRVFGSASQNQRMHHRVMQDWRGMGEAGRLDNDAVW